MRADTLGLAGLAATMDASAPTRGPLSLGQAGAAYVVAGSFALAAVAMARPLLGLRKG